MQSQAPSPSSRTLAPEPSRRAEPPRPEGARSNSTAPKLLEPWDEHDAVRAAANRELHPDLLKLGAERLSWISLSAAALLGGYAAVAFWSLRRAEARPGEAAPGLLLGGAILSLVLFATVRAAKLRPQRALELGYAFLFLISLCLGLVRYGQDWVAGEALRHVSWSVLPILAFAALVPATRRTSLTVCIAAALMDPLALFLMKNQVATPAGAELALALASPAVGALVAVQLSRALHRLNERVLQSTEIGSYRLTERIGTGGMAEVWRADHRMLARPAAVKLIRPELLLGQDPLETQRLLRIFLREARTTASLSSPHTIQVYDFGITREGAFYYVAELLNGVDLKTLVDRFGPQPPERVIYLLRGVCKSLQEAHARNFVHRDVKPANIFACRLGGEHDFAKVLDFGLVLDRHPTAEELEDEKRFVGTPAIMAPEMVRFQAPVDARADIYAVGCVAYWLLTGRRVFEAENRQDMLVMHAHQKPILPSKRANIALPAKLEAAVMACLEKSPGRRPQTARELEELLADVEVEHPWTEERARLWWQKNLPESGAPASIRPSGPEQAESEEAQSVPPGRDGALEPKPAGTPGP